MKAKMISIAIGILCSLLSFPVPSQAETGGSGEGENASNPLAAVNNTDVRWQYFHLDGAELNDFWLDGAYMLTPKLKLKYELHYWDTDVTGNSESDFESLHLKAIYFPMQGEWGKMKYRMAVGLEWILDFGNEDKGIGSGSDQIAPLFGIALMPGGGLVLVPLVQHFVEYNGPEVNLTAFRVIAIQSLPNKFWVKLDTKFLLTGRTTMPYPLPPNYNLEKCSPNHWGLMLMVLSVSDLTDPMTGALGLGCALSTNKETGVAQDERKDANIDCYFANGSGNYKSNSK